MKMDTTKLVKIGVVAAIYAALTALFATISFTPMQLRVSEVMVLLAFFDPIYIIGLTMGCFITNMLMSPYFLLDGVFGTLATLLSVTAIYYTGKVTKQSKIGLVIASIWPTLFNGVIVGWIIYMVEKMADPTLVSVKVLFGLMGSVAIGEFIVVTLMGVPVFLLLKQKYSEILGRWVSVNKIK